MDPNLLLQKVLIKKKNWAKWTKTRLKTIIYMRPSLKNSSKSKSHSLNAAHKQKTSLAQKKLVHTANLLTLIFRSKRRLNE